ncbi:hypothetical protein EJ04DRAFT_507171 [Polyplosphaeria fusca]|uniref:Uncharacterized protein n=1 Tax=Polyplosphaeria fusca TaxID=682080 RepID=A0A9P4R984_9PLEO|nr:hypothetical protein EJ04DRAFT_507171 [Polyplosphaeria fusca]
MSRSGINMATTADGATYNKLTRPDDYLSSLSGPPPPPKPPKPAVSPKASPTENNIKGNVMSTGMDDHLKPDRTVSAAAESFERVKRKYDDSQSSGDELERNAAGKRLRLGDRDQKLWERGVRGTNPNRRMNIECNMQVQFPGLDQEGFTSDEDTNAAFAYLHSVRAESSNIPQVLLAVSREENGEADRSMYENGRGDMRVYYEDGTFIYRELDGFDDPMAGTASFDSDSNPEDQYHRQLIKRYRKLCATLSQTTPDALAERAKDDPSILENINIPRNQQEWLRTLDNEDPKPASICLLNKKDLLNGIKHCADTMCQRKSISKHRSRWIWTLLAKVGDRGTLDYSEIGRIRDLSHQAGQFGIRMRKGLIPQEVSEQESEDIESWEPNGLDGDDEDSDSDVGSPHGKHTSNDTGNGAINIQKAGVKTTSAMVRAQVANGENSGPPVLDRYEEGLVSDSAMSISEDGEVCDADDSNDLEVARARVLAQLGDRLVQPKTAATTESVVRETRVEVFPDNTRTDDVDWNSRVTVDMIITIAAECYGQKDLLRFRSSWSEDKEYGTC